MQPIKKYDPVSRTLHWLIVLAILTMIGLGISFGYTSGKTFSTLMFIHKSLGMTILLLMILRVIWKFTGMYKPEYSFDMQAANRFAASSVHALMYLCLFIMPLSGWFGSSLAGYPVPFWGLANLQLPLVINKPLASIMFDIHSTTIWVLVSLIVLHILGAIYHERRKERVIRRML